MGELVFIDQKNLISVLDICTQEDIQEHPGAVGAQLVEDGLIDAAILGAIDGKRSAERDYAMQEIMSGLVMEGSVEWGYVRFPRLHKALGRLVIGNKRYYTPVHPEPV